jgi:hypothetical protein
MYRIIEPEVGGRFGSGTKLDNNVHPPIVKELDYEFDGWLGDDLLESFPCFIMSERLRKEIEKLSLTGIKFQNLTISKSDTYKELYPSKELPIFYWAIIDGKIYLDDFIIGDDLRLVISEKAFELLKKFNIDNASLESID